MNDGFMMRKTLMFILAFLPVIAIAQKDYKLVEQSSKEKPAWLSEGTHKGYFMVQANKVATLDEAKSNATLSLLNDIASSISVIVVGETVKDIVWEEVELNGQTQEQFIETIKTNTTTKISKIPALQGISIDLKGEIYWERYINKKTKESCYDYYILYPFSQFELEELVDAYNAQEKAINDKIESYRTALDKTDNIDAMLENISQMKAMKEEHKDEYAKVSKLETIIALYEKTIKDIYIEIVDNYNKNNKGTLVIQLKHGEKVMKTKSLPKLGSECARDFNKRLDGDKIVITFNTFDCYEQDDNYVDVRFTFGKRKLVKKISINM